jgi:hypothetical protein
MQLRKNIRILTTFNRLSPILKNSISRLLEIGTKSISIDSEVLLVVV